MTFNNCIIEVDCIKCGESDLFVSSIPPKYVCQTCLEKEKEKYEAEMQAGEITQY